MFEDMFSRIVPILPTIRSLAFWLSDILLIEGASLVTGTLGMTDDQY